MANGEVYDGLWDKDMRNKKGTATFTNGDVYEGLWMDNLVITQCCEMLLHICLYMHVCV